MNSSSQARKQIGVFGGTFDPPHVGHLIIAERARQQLGLSEVVFVPAFHAPHKRDRGSSAARHRVLMLRRALKGLRGFKVSDIEVKRGGISYTVDTLRAFRRAHPRADLWLIVGSDNLRDFFTWRQPGAILSMCRIAVYRRPGYPTPAAIRKRTAAVVLRGGMIDVSATKIRGLERRSRSIRTLVPADVQSYIRRNRLYTAVTDRTRP